MARGCGRGRRGRFLPGAPHEHAGLFWGLLAITVAYSVGCITRLIPWHRSGLAGHAVAVVSLQPLLVAALWLTGGADSYLGPVLVLPMLYVAYFFPARYAWPLAAVEIATYASPFVTSDGGHLLPARTLSYAVAYVGLVLTIQFLKQRLVQAESHQRLMANQDPLTGLANRRAFDTALSAALADGSGTRFTLLLADIDAFKQINDRFGHTTGDRVLREVAAHTSDAVRARRLPGADRRRRARAGRPGCGRRGGAPVRRRAARGRRARRHGRRPGLADGLLGGLPRGRDRPLHADALARPRAARGQGPAPRGRAAIGARGGDHRQHHDVVGVLLRRRGLADHRVVGEGEQAAGQEGAGGDRDDVLECPRMAREEDERQRGDGEREGGAGPRLGRHRVRGGEQEAGAEGGADARSRAPRGRGGG